MLNDFSFISLIVLLSVILILNFKFYKYPFFINPLFFFIFGVLLFIGLPYFIDPVMKDYSYTDFSKVAIFTILGTFSFFIGWLIVKKKRINNNFRIFHFKPKLYLVYISFLVGFLIQWFLSKKFGPGLLERIVLIRAGYGLSTDNIWESFWRIPYSFSFGFINASSFLAIYFLMKKQIKNRFLKLLNILIFLITLVLNFSTGTRMNIFTVLFAPLIIYLYGMNNIRSFFKVKRFIFISFMFIVSFFSIAVLSNMRYTGLKSELNINFLNIVTYGLNQIFDFNKAITMFPKERDFLYGSTYLAILVNPIPREFFPSKPVGIGAIIGDVDPISRAGTSISITFFGEAYANFGIIGVILVPFIGGVISKIIFNYIRNNFNNEAIKIMYLYILPFYTIEVRGGFLEITMRLFIEFLVLFLIIKISFKIVRDEK